MKVKKSYGILVFNATIVESGVKHQNAIQPIKIDNIFLIRGE